MDICSSPQLIAAYHVFRRLLVPRHPPYALFCLTSRLILQSPLICSVISIGLFVIIYFVNGYIVSLTFVSVWILWLDVLLIINGYLLSLSVWCFQGTFPDVLPEWRWGDSNPWPLDCQSSALPTELHPHSGFGYWLNFNQFLMWFFPQWA